LLSWKWAQVRGLGRRRQGHEQLLYSFSVQMTAFVVEGERHWLIESLQKALQLLGENWQPEQTERQGLLLHLALG